ncbi:MAG: hypothetical protein MUF84_14035 [Anaerolineae bacterium]|jgi:hypothetical protein|nr:hypothetical protein [Anaerolineae bacterium]
MLEVTVKLPETLSRLSEAERDGLIRAGVHEAARARIRQLESEIALSEEAVARFEQRYGMPLARFEAEVLTHEDSLEAHEDYNDSFYWHSVLHEKQQLLADLSSLELA